jgi:oligopeptide/dipeptide ABC transporter ATP-binding protein
MNGPLLEVRTLTVALQDGSVPVDGVSLSVRPREIVALVGESGSGKTLTARALLGLLPEPEARVVCGSVRFRGEELLGASPARLRELRGAKIGMVFQEPGAALDPLFSVGWQLEEAIAAHRAVPRARRRLRALELLAQVRLADPEACLRAYPHQLSGGMRQRVGLALALAESPELLIADEPTTALDVTLQAEVLSLLEACKDELGLAVLLITHDLGVVAEIADRVVVLHGGQVIEDAPVAALFAVPRHPLTTALLAAQRGDLEPCGPQVGAPAVTSAVGAGCRYRLRCPAAERRCALEAPQLIDGVRCFFPRAAAGTAP